MFNQTNQHIIHIATKNTWNFHWIILGYFLLFETIIAFMAVAPVDWSEILIPIELKNGLNFTQLTDLDRPKSDSHFFQLKSTQSVQTRIQYTHEHMPVILVWEKKKTEQKTEEKIVFHTQTSFSM